LDTISFKVFHDELEEHRQIKCIEQTDDMIIGVTGDEGSGKSTISLGLGGIDPNFYNNYLQHQEQIYFLWDKFLNANKICTYYASSKALENLPIDKKNQYLDRLLEKYNIPKEKYDIPSDSFLLKPGSTLQYDEAGTQMFSRDHQNKSVKDQVKLFISNRSNRMIYTLNVPKSKYLDKYIREERLKYFIYVKKSYPDGDLRKPTRIAYIWGKDRYKKLLTYPYWWQLFDTNMGKLFKISSPNFRIEVPNLIKKFIPEEVNNLYQFEKTIFQLRQALEMEGDKSITNNNDNPDAKITLKDFLENCPRYKERYKEYTDRTGKSKSTYYNYINDLKRYGVIPTEHLVIPTTPTPI